MSKSKYHTDKYGIKKLIKDLELDHLENIIKYIKRRAKEGIVCRYGCGVDADDIWYDEEIIYGKDVKKRMNYKAYKKELKRRKELIT